MKDTDGGAAFPGMNTNPSEGNPRVRGMSLRDYFAAKFIGAILDVGEGPRAPEQVEHFAARCYELADAMLKARGR